MTLILALAALAAGFWLDNRMGTRPIMTIALVLVSVPITMILIYRIALSGAAKIQEQSRFESAVSQDQEEEDGKTSPVEMGR